MEEKIRNAIKKALSDGRSNFIIYPFGQQGKLFKSILNNEFGIEEVLIIDNGNKDDDKIKCFNELDSAFFANCTVFIVSDNTQIFWDVRSQAINYVPEENIIDVLTNEWGTIDMQQEIQNSGEVKVFFNQLKRYYSADSAEDLGKNTGNIVYIEAMREQLDYDLEVWLSEEWTKDKLGKGNVTAIMPASNFVDSYTTWYEAYIPLLEKTDMKFTFAGLGAQAAFNQTPKDVVNKLSEKQIYFFRLVSDHAAQIGVRGEFTAECLKEMGITNIEVIGCPSFYQYLEHYPVLTEPTLDKVLYTADKVKKEIYSLAEQVDSHLICQGWENTTKGEQTVFYDFKEWNDYISDSKFTFAFGSRFHGNMMALRNRIPTLWLVHDWRTLELAQYLGLPYLNYYDSKFKKIKYVEELLEYCDYSKVYERYPQLNKRYCDFIRKNFDKNFRVQR